MAETRRIRTALVSVFHKDGLDEIIRALHNDGVKFLSTGGTRAFIAGLGIECEAVEDLTGYPSILGGRVKTLHPKVFGGILSRRDNEGDNGECSRYEIPAIDLVIVDLYPFEQTVATPGATPEDIIEKIDIGGISLIRAAAKNFNDVAIVASKAQYGYLRGILDADGAVTTLEQRRWLAKEAFAVSSAYDSAIFNWFDGAYGQPTHLRYALDGVQAMRYGENPHQKGWFFGHLDQMFDKLHGKDISYNNLGDIDAATALIAEFDPAAGVTTAILKHNNACGVATRPLPLQAWQDALAGDPVSAFGGIIVTNSPVDAATAAEINKIFFEVIIGPEYSQDALAILEQKKNRIILVQKQPNAGAFVMRTALNGALKQERDNAVETPDMLRPVTKVLPTAAQVDDMLFANKIVKHSKSNAIVLAKNGQLLGSGVGQTSRVDALRHAIEKANSFNLPLDGAVMASDAFFPFGDCVEIANRAGITAVIQPGGSIRDNESVDFCNSTGMAMVMTGLRHFRH